MILIKLIERKEKMIYVLYLHLWNTVQMVNRYLDVASLRGNIKKILMFLEIIQNTDEVKYDASESNV